VFLLLAGLIFRGVAFEFRFKARTSRYLWNWSFAGGSTIAAFAQGAVVGAYIQGFNTVNGAYVGGALDWLTPFTVLTGLGMLAGYALLGSTWLIMKTEGRLQEWAYRVSAPLLIAVLVVFGIISVWTPFVDDMVRERWFSNLSVIWILPALTLLCAFQIWRSVRNRFEGMPFVATMGLFITTYLGLVVSKWPYVVPPNYTLWDAASAYESQLFLLLGLLFVIPIVLAYTAWTYWVFRGKVRAGEGYH
jgi:cytochrome d ubiquinol oxidase subunit II